MGTDYTKRPEETQQESKLTNVTKGKVTVKEKSESKKFIESLVEEDAKNIGQYIRDDVLIPTFKELLSNIVVNSIEMLLYGDSGRRPSGSHVAYNKMYERNSRNTVRQGSVRSSDRQVARPRGRFDIKELEFESRADADMVLTMLFDHIDEYGRVSVGDYYSACDITPAWTDYNFGWFNLTQAHVDRSRGVWVIRFPRPEALND